MKRTSPQHQGTMRIFSASEKVGESCGRSAAPAPERRWLRALAIAGSLSVLVWSAIPASTTVSRGYSGTQMFSTLGADKDEGEPNHCGEPGGASSWFFYQAPTNGVMVVDTRGSSFDTVLAVYTGPGTDFESLVSVACNNDAGVTEAWSQVSFTTTAGTLYYIAVDGVGGASGTVALNYNLAASQPLAIIDQPESQVVGVAASATFRVRATGKGPLSYQWSRGGTPLPGATADTLVLSELRPEDEGTYVATVTDGNATVASVPAALTVFELVPPTNQVALQRVELDGQGCFRVAGHAAVGAVIEASSDLQHWVPLHTNQSPQGLFRFDDNAQLPVRYYRLRLTP